MMWDLLLIEKLAEELRRGLSGARVGGVKQLDNHGFSAALKGSPRAGYLWVSGRPGFPFVRLSGHPAGEEIQLGWLHQLTIRIQDAVFTDAEALPLHSTVKLTLTARDHELRLFFELDRRFPNVILTDSSETILVCLRSWRSPNRVLHTGETYLLPAKPGSLDPRSASTALWREALAATARAPDWTEALFRAAKGLSRPLARELAHRAGLVPHGPPQPLPEETLAGLARAAAELLTHPTGAVLLYPQGHGQARPFLSAVTLESFADCEVTEFAELSPAVAAVARWERAQRQLEDLKDEARKRVSAVLEQTDKLSDSLAKERDRCREHGLLRVKGELIYNNIYRLRKGVREFTALNYHLDPPQELLVELDPALTPAENADRTFKLAGRLERGLALCESRLEEERERALRLTALQERIAAVQTVEELERLLEEAELPSKQRRHAAGAQTPEERLPFRRYIVHKKWEVLVGRSGRDNLELLRNHTRPDDLWLHVRGFSGSHVVVKNPKRRELPPLEVIRRAAQFAAHFSKAAKGEYLPVIYTFRKFVTPVKGAHPGAVRCLREDIIFVDPEEPAESEIQFEE